jgi:uncharacterized protein YdcH (DUF465 family)
MSHTPHELHEEFPGRAARMSLLKASDPAYAALAERYHVVNRAIHRAEAGIEPVSDDHLTGMRRERLHLKDRIRARLGESAA